MSVVEPRRRAPVVRGRRIDDAPRRLSRREAATSGRGQVLVPWPNRIEDGSYEFDGKRMQLPLTEPEHGERDPRSRPPGDVERRRTGGRPRRAGARARAAAGLSLHARARHQYALSDAGLTVRDDGRATSARSRARTGCGQHPYLTLGTPTIDGLRAAGRRRSACCFSDERGLPDRLGARSTEPSTTSAPAGRSARRSSTTRSRSSARDADGRARVLLDDPASGSGSHALGRRELRLPHGLHRRPLARRRPAQHRGRADDVSAERVPHGRLADPARAGCSRPSTAWGIEPRLQEREVPMVQ